MPTGIYPRKPFQRRFWERVKKTKNCWLWTGPLFTKTGYGSFWFNRRTWSAHRISWLIHNGEIPKGLCVLHRCDVRRCVYPEHLWLGTIADNDADRDRKQRNNAVYGSKHHWAILNESKVKKILRMRKNGMRYCNIAKEFGVKAGTIEHIFHGHSWANLTKIKRSDRITRGD